MAKIINHDNTEPKSGFKLFFERYGYDMIRVILGIVILSVLLSISLDMINDQFATKQEELVKEQMKDFGWIVLAFGYTVPLILACTVPLVMCLGSKKDAQRKHLIKALIIAGTAVIILLCVCPGQIKEYYEQREICLNLEKFEQEDEDFEYPENQPTVEEVTLQMQRVVEWTAKAGLGLAVVGAYQGVRYKKLRDGDADEEVPPDELDDNLPDVDWNED